MKIQTPLLWRPARLKETKQTPWLEFLLTQTQVGTHSPLSLPHTLSFPLSIITISDLLYILRGLGRRGGHSAVRTHRQTKKIQINKWMNSIQPDQNSQLYWLVVYVLKREERIKKTRSNCCCAYLKIKQIGKISNHTERESKYFFVNLNPTQVALPVFLLHANDGVWLLLFNFKLFSWCF